MLNIILLQGNSQGGGASFLILMVGMIVVFYFFMFRPQQKKQKDQKKFIAEVKRGDKIVTVGGIYGRIFEISDDTVIIEVEKGAKIKIDKTSISLESTKKVSK